MKNETKVVNLYKDKYDIYIGRAGKGREGYFGNPIAKVVCPKCKIIHKNKDSLPCFEEYLYWKLNSDSEFKSRFLELEGKTLGCFCKPKDCHGDVIIKVLNKILEKEM